MTAALKSGTPRGALGNFLVLGGTMTWQLALVVLIPLVAGAELDKKFKTSPVLTLVGLALALAGTALVLKHIVSLAGKLPVPKLTPAEKARLQKLNEQEDKENDE